jgi:PAS domain S-box-containing protein
MNFLDLRTILFSYAISNAICAMVMSSTWLQNRRHSPGMGFWLADFILQFMAVLLIVLRGSVPDFFSIVAANLLVWGGTLLLYIGLEQYVDKRSSQLHNYLLLGVFFCVHVYFTYAQPSLRARNLNTTLGLIVLCSQCAWLLLRRVDAELRSVTKFAGFTFIAYGLVSAVRFFADWMVPGGNDLFKSGLYDTLVILTYQMLFIALTFALLLMSHRRLFAELEQDVSQRQRAELAFQKSQEKFTAVFGNILDAMVITRIDTGMILEVNEGFFQIAHYSREEIIGKTTIDLNLWATLVDRDKFVEELQKRGRVQNYETHFRRKSGELFPALISGEVIQLSEGRCVLNVIRDVTERMQSEREIERLASFPRLNPNPVLEVDSTGKIIFANEAARRALLELEVDDVRAFLPADIHSLLFNRMADVAAACQREVNIAGRIFIETIDFVPAFKTLRIYAADITTRKQLEEKSKYQAMLLANVNDAIVATDDQDRLTAWNTAAELLYGWQAEEVLGRNELEIMQTEWPGVDVEEMDLAIAEKGGWRGEVTQVQKNGMRVPVELSSLVIKDEGGKVTGHVSVNRVITERKKAEELIRASEVRYRRLFESAKDGILILDAETGMIVDVNPFLINLLGHTREIFLGKRIWELGFFKDVIANRENFLELQQTDYLRYEDLPLETAFGKTVEVEFVSNVYLVNHQRVIQCNIRDISERKLAEGKLLAAHAELKRLLIEADQSQRVLLSVIEDQKAAEDEIRNLNADLEERVRTRTAQLVVANTELESFAYSVSHDLRAPLRGIDGWSLAVMEDYYDMLDSQGKQYLEFIRADTQRMGRLIDDLLNLSRVTRAEINKEKVDLTAIARSILGRLQQAEPSRVVKIVLQPGLAGQGDPALMEIMLTNLLSNAWKFTSKSANALIEFGQIEKDGHPVFFLRDNGVGFDMAYARKLFGVFQRMHKESDFPGTGVGLATVQRIIHRHGGRIWVESQVNQGATFYFTLEE